MIVGQGSVQARRGDYYATHSQHTVIRIIIAHSHSPPSSGLLSHTVTAHRHPDYYGTQSRHAVIGIIMVHIYTVIGIIMVHIYTVIRIIMAHSYSTLSSGLL